MATHDNAPTFTRTLRAAAARLSGGSSRAAAILLALLAAGALIVNRALPASATMLRATEPPQNLARLLPVLATGTRRTCSDAALVMPACARCIIGGGVPAVGGGCPPPADAVSAIRAEVATLAATRFGAGASISGEPPHLYPYLETTAFTARHALLAHWMASEAPASILEIGGYFQSAGNFLHGFCPELVVNVDPIFDTSSAIVPCVGSGAGGGETHVAVVPATARDFFSNVAAVAGALVPPRGHWDAVVCVGCDAHYGPTAAHFLALPRPTTLYLDFALAYAPSVAAFAPLLTAPGASVLLNATLDLRSYPGIRTDYERRALYVLRLE